MGPVHHTRGRDGFALAGAEFKADPAGGSSELSESETNRPVVPCEAAIVKI